MVTPAGRANRSVMSLEIGAINGAFNDETKKITGIYCDLATAQQ